LGDVLSHTTIIEQTFEKIKPSRASRAAAALVIVVAEAAPCERRR